MSLNRYNIIATVTIETTEQLVVGAQNEDDAMDKAITIIAKNLNCDESCIEIEEIEKLNKPYED